mmetsp:Transcript_9436/g.17746  ORF Transcript_9436/g.17746 Transcript_9436/m.17746 type:complete len:250 (-) Transcript_9436:1101-1850(-)
MASEQRPLNPAPPFSCHSFFFEMLPLCFVKRLAISPVFNHHSLPGRCKFPHRQARCTFPEEDPTYLTPPFPRPFRFEIMPSLHVSSSSVSFTIILFTAATKNFPIDRARRFFFSIEQYMFNSCRFLSSIHRRVRISQFLPLLPSINASHHRPSIALVSNHGTSLVIYWKAPAPAPAPTPPPACATIGSKFALTLRNVCLTKSLCLRMRGRRGCSFTSFPSALAPNSSNVERNVSTCSLSALAVWGKYCW